MRKTLFLLFAVFAFVSCNDISNEEARVQSKSSGNINNLSLIMDNELWKGEVGEAVRKNMAMPVDGLPQEEPLFSLRQMPPESFEGFARKNRIFLKIEKGKPANVKIGENPYAKPQTGIVISGQNDEEIVDLLEENSEKIIEHYKRTELKENQRRISKSLLADSKLKEELGVSLKFSTAYRYAKEENGFFWIRKDIPNGSMEILVYEVPLNTFEKDTNVIGNIIKIRDSIGREHIPGPTEGSYMITEAAYAPYLFESQIDGKFAYETKGTWEVKNAFMAGPFLSYAIRDEANDRYVILEGFTFRPSAPKRDNMFELEAILKSAKIK